MIGASKFTPESTMAMNRVQFQPGLSMVEFMERFGDEEHCRTALQRARWPDGFVCPRCQGSGYSWLIREGRQYYQCSTCRKQTTLTSDTIFASTKLPLTRWFLAMHLLTQAKNNVSALELKRHLGVSYRTAWMVKHKLMQVMTDRERGRVLGGRVEIEQARGTEAATERAAHQHFAHLVPPVGQQVRLGAARGHGSALYLTLGTGIASAFAIEGRVWAGERGEAIALGELPVASRPDERLEPFASGEGIRDRKSTRLNSSHRT